VACTAPHEAAQRRTPMKIWQSMGSEHSMNLVMIGRFDEATDAETVKGIIDKLIATATADAASGNLDYGGRTTRYSDQMQATLADLELYSLAPHELEQFTYDVDVTRRGNRLVIKTDEVEVQAFLKVLLFKGARIEVFSAHDHEMPED
jgi:hypothetical protein